MTRGLLLGEHNVLGGGGGDKRKRSKTLKVKADNCITGQLCVTHDQDITLN